MPGQSHSFFPFGEMGFGKMSTAFLSGYSLHQIVFGFISLEKVPEFRSLSLMLVYSFPKTSPMEPSRFSDQQQESLPIGAVMKVVSGSGADLGFFFLQVFFFQDLISFPLL